jgi:hypothetical protein
MTEDQAALRQLMRLRGFSLMTNILDDYAKELDIISLVYLVLVSSFRLSDYEHAVGSRVHAYMAFTAQEQSRGLQGLCACQRIRSV